ncbi:LytR/AlgR family response regulator transcription factor [Parapedobacter koreensis]|uniref:Two component transcriptional regulator, LytTR family n=1 Tax=Parapedobacter koreensis TaxID=332977 RepID=A0A1H7TK80_9SPHI|nr:LytTR family DNA-binding domain-containing protein [Parapedobacter koreensis]SEL84965.1 two component transcriptional regulator, LytTR family [Parapedobacter koreensis]
MIRTLIIDDEPHCVTALLHDINRLCPQIEVIATCNSAKEGMLAIVEHRPDLIFLDIDMPVMDGFELLEALKEDRCHFQVIFTTAYDEFTLRAIRVNAMDYLLKPVDGTELTEAVSRVSKYLRENTSQATRITSLLQLLRTTGDQQRIALPNRNGYEFIDTDDVLYCKADGAYTQFVLVDGRKILISKSLSEIGHMLPDPYFIRIHHSSMVNIRKISHFKKFKTSVVVMSDGEHLNVSRSRKDELLLKMGVKSVTANKDFHK